jgi:hypothetical protein
MPPSHQTRFERFLDFALLRKKAPRWANWLWFLGSCGIYGYSFFQTLGFVNDLLVNDLPSMLGMFVVAFINSFWGLVYWNLGVLATVALVDMITGNAPQLQDPDKVIEHRLKNLVP